MITKKFWQGKKVFLTGHTGFKGAWMCLLLEEMGATVKGYALAPSTTPSLFSLMESQVKCESIIGDIRDTIKLEKELSSFNPDVVIHMAAQPLVRYSYDEPVETFEVNVMGTVRLLEACRKILTIKTILNVTTDKCYHNNEWLWGYREIDPLGGKDPYSASKACSELVTAAYSESFLKDKAVITARAGNVIGGGDWAKDRLIPDFLTAHQEDRAFQLRNPSSIRPWQHVLEPLKAYLLLVEKSFDDKNVYRGAWNIGPRIEDCLPTSEVIQKLLFHMNKKTPVEITGQGGPHEANFLMLDCSKIQKTFNWKPTWTLDESLQKIAQWHEAFLKKENAYETCSKQIKEFLK